MENNQNEKSGLSQANRKLIVGIFIACLLQWGPIGSFGLIVNIASSVLSPVLLYFCLGYWGKDWNMDAAMNERLTCAIYGAVAGALFVFASQSFTSKYHYECNKQVQTRDGTECVGDYVRVNGPDKSTGAMQIIFGSLAVWLAMNKKNET